ncbi:MAG: HAD family hydrolase [Bacteroidales bacterium]|nr:HAD family hydrolase [Bacteroidales bacterium]
MKYKHIVFDIDGTLIDSETTLVLSLQQTVKEVLGKDMAYEELVPFFGIPSLETLNALNFPDYEEGLEIWEKHFREKFSLIVPYEGVSNFLHDLARSGAQMGIVTSRNLNEIGNDPNLEQWLVKDRLFGTIIGANDTVLHKPDPAPLLEYVRRTGAKPSECLYVGDTVMDSSCGLGAGCDFCLVSHRRPADRNIPATHYADGLDDLKAILS